ncbi:MAG: FG-GAP-like repeat-containing protein [Bacteroidota bacterium]
MLRLPTLGNCLVIGLAFFLNTFLSNSSRAQTQNTSFSVQSNLLPLNGRSGAPIGVADMNGDKKDDIILLDNRNTLVIQTQNAPNQAFSTYQTTAIGSNQWSLCIGDYDHNGRNDVLVGGAYTNIRLYAGDPATESLSGSILTNSNIFLQGSNFADINNDGWADIFTCHDDADNRKYKNNGDGTFTFDNSLLPTAFSSSSDDAGNYASIWTDYDNDGDLDMYLSKCRQGATSYTDPRRINRLFQNDGNNNYTEVGVAAGLAFGAQTWTADFADVDNDGDLDAFINNHDDDCQLMRNNGDGTFTDVTAASGLLPTLGAAANLIGIQAIFRDFDNDGYVDLLYSGSSHYLFYNDGDGTFTLASNPANPLGTLRVHSFAIGDLNHDGFLDVYAGHGSGFNGTSGSNDDDLFLNAGNSNHYLALDLIGTQSNINAIGARLEAYVGLSKQIREVRSGEGYGIMNSFTQHFGLGSATLLDSLIIRWPSGLVNKYYNLSADQFITYKEHDNTLDANFVADQTVAYPAPVQINFDASSTFSPVPGTLTYDWNFGDGTTGSGQSIAHTFAVADSYMVTLTVSNLANSETDTDSLLIVIGNSIDDFPSLDPDFDNDGIPNTLERSIGQFSFTTASATIPPDGLDATQTVDLSSTGVSIGTTVKLSDLVADGDLNSTGEDFSLDFNNGEYVVSGFATGTQCTGSLTTTTSNLNGSITVVDIGSGTPTPGITIKGTSGLEVDDLTGCSAGITYQLKVSMDGKKDVDGDGIDNEYDLDSDNDGVWDVVEAGGVDVDGDAFIDNPADQASLTTPPNTDGDDLPDFVDLESTNVANDGIGPFDIAATDFGYFDTNGDGQITSADTDGGIDDDLDGLDDLIDGNKKEKGAAPFGEHVFVAGHSVARMWNEVLLEGIRGDFARPTVHARNLYHISSAMYDAWSAYEGRSHSYLLGNSISGFNISFNNLPTVADSVSAQKEAISYAAYRLIMARFANSPGRNNTLFIANLVMQELGYSTAITSTDYQNGGPAELGNYIADRILAFGAADNSNESNDFANLYYQPANNFLEIAKPGNPNLTKPNRWQPLAFDVFIDQSGNVTSSNTPDFLSPEWGNVPGFAMSQYDKSTYTRDGDTYEVWHDPGQPPMLDTIAGGGTTDLYQWGFSMVATWSKHLDPNDGVMWDISPASIGNVPFSELPDGFDDYDQFYDYLDGGTSATGRSLNPHTGQPYQAQNVPRGDYARVLAEFWADGPDSETPPGHWFTILNYVSDNPLLEKKWQGQGATLSDLEWDVKTYFTMGGTMHDAAISAWSVKGWYDYIRPVSALRYMALRGQSSDPSAASYDPAGMPLVSGYIELVELGDPLAGPGNVNVGKIKINGWKGPNFIIDPAEDLAGVDWILADEWWPYQRPSFVTPPFAGYVSGHSTYSRAAAEIMTYMTGDEYFPGGMGEFYCPKDEFLVFEQGPSVDVTLQWATYRDASDECSLSRIWGGIHPPADDIPGRKIGKAVGIRSFAYADSIFSAGTPSVQIKAFLEGTYAGSDSMRASLVNILPLTDPFGLGSTADSDVMDKTGALAPVDWVVVELRAKADPTIILDSVAAIIRANGEVVSPLGKEAVTFPDFEIGEYYVALRHANHLGVMTANTVTVNADAPLLDFSDPTTAVFSNGGPAMKNDNGVMLLWSGDANSDGTINAVDNINFWQVENGQPYNYGINQADFNLDATVNAVDLNLYWLINNSRIEQLP